MPKFEIIRGRVKTFCQATLNGFNYPNCHCVVSSMLCVPVWDRQKFSYLAIPLGYRMWQKKESKLQLTASVVRQVMPEFSRKRNVIILCDSWYVKKYLVSIEDDCPNLGLIDNARTDSVIYDLAPEKTWKRGRPAKHGLRLSIDADFSLSQAKAGDYYIGCRRVLTNIFRTKEVMAYVTSPSREARTMHLFFSTVFPSQP